ncbi:MAG: ribosome biogenesis GTPase Der [Clostridia bacterium]|nr:ribosome biogenesis GTPase Der [Clostridia bacterium]
MKKLPVVAIIGRPNVGKSSFFNFVTGRRISIVEDTPGVTRDRIYEKVEWRGRNFTMIDTGGLEVGSEDPITIQMRRQAETAAELADVILFMVDLSTGLTAGDEDIATLLRKTGKPVIVAVNKADKVGDMPPEAYEFYNLGLGELYPISSAHGLGIGEVLDALFELMPEPPEEGDEGEVISVAVVGKPNAGKSSLVNRIIGSDRVIVSDVPGTTRDAIDTYTKVDGQEYCFIDTAGLRKRGRISDNIEKYSTVRSLGAIDRSHVVILLIDATDGVTEQDTKIAGYALEQGKGIIIAVNKWDLIEKETDTMEKYRTEVLNKLNFIMFSPVMFLSALTGSRVSKLFDMIRKVYDASSRRITTGLLNDCLTEAMITVQPPSDKGKRLKIYYITQIGTFPPSFVIKCNSKALFHFSYLRYIENQIRKNFDFTGTPIRFKIREKDEEGDD